MVLPKSTESTRAGVAQVCSRYTEVISGDALFNDLDADIVLRSADFVDFRTYKIILSMASPVFKDMLTLPQPLPESAVEFARGSFHSEGPPSVDSILTISTEDRSSFAEPAVESPASAAVPVIKLTETRKTLRCLLTCISPSLTDVPESYEDTLAVLAAAQKYQMRGALADLRAFTKPAFDSIPHYIALRVFGFACRYKLREEASVAAWRTLGTTMSLESYGSDLKFVTGSTLYELMQYRRSCESAVYSVVGGIRGDLSWLVGKETHHRCVELFKLRKTIELLADVGPPAWWINHWDVVLDGLKSGQVFPTAQSVIDQSSFQDSLRAHAWKARCKACCNVSNEAVASFCAKMQGHVERATRQVQLDFDSI